KHLLGESVATRPTYDAPVYQKSTDFLADLKIIADSLEQHNSGAVVHLRLAALMQTVSVFGFHLASVDLRQSSDVHERVLTELFNAAGVTHNGNQVQYDAMSESERVELLLSEIKQARPLVSPWFKYSEE